jgi:hypothetical protein
MVIDICIEGIGWSKTLMVGSVSAERIQGVDGLCSKIPRSHFLSDVGVFECCRWIELDNEQFGTSTS